MSDPVSRLNAALEGRYAIERELGEGGMATVYLATDLKHARNVALKVLKPELAAVVGAERFLAEIKTTANLTHPHILPLHDSGEADGFLFYVMPHIEGESLRERIDREKQLPVDEAVKITTDLAEALDYAHRHKIIHRDIKPANILIHEGRPLIADFGIALAVGVAGGGRLTETGLSVGTPHYMSPEQATGDPMVGAPTDIYALGCALFEMLVGEPPYTGATAQAVLGQIIAGETASATEKRASVPANVDAAVRCALERLPADRFTSAQEFARALADSGFRHGETAAAAAPPLVWKHRALGLAAVALLAIAGGAWGWLRQMPGPVMRFELTLPDGLGVFTGSGANIAISPDGSHVVFVGSDGAGRTQLWLRSLDQLLPTPLAGTANGRNPRFSPDGTSIAFTGNQNLIVVSLEAAPPRTVVTGSVPETQAGLAWGTDGMLYFRKTDLGIWRVPANGGEAEEVTVLGAEFGHTWLDFLPGGKGILFTRDSPSPIEEEIAVFSLETGETTFLVRGAMARYAHSGHLVYTSSDGGLLAVPFDLDRLEVAGPPRTLIDGIQVNFGSSSYFAIAETGVLVDRPGAVGGVGGTPLWLGRDGREELLDPALVGSFQAPAVSPDGRRIALEHQPLGGATDIWIYDLDQETFLRLTFEGVNRRPFWHPDGEEIGFVSDREGQIDVYARSADGSGEVRLLRNAPTANVPVFEALWSPDARWLVYRQGTGGNIDLLYAAPEPDSTPQTLLDTPFRESQPSLSPNGEWLAYQSDESGRDEVYVRPFPPSGGRSPVSVDGGRSPVWAHNGREIFYLSPDGAMVVARVRTEPGFVVESREPIAGGHRFEIVGATQQYDLTPDDEQLLILRFSPAETAVRDIVVLNFFEELNRLVPN